MEFLIFAIISGAVLYRNRKDNLVREATTFDPTKKEPGVDEVPVTLANCKAALQAVPDEDLRDDIGYVARWGTKAECNALADKIEKDHPFIAKCLRARP